MVVSVSAQKLILMNEIKLCHSYIGIKYKECGVHFFTCMFKKSCLCSVNIPVQYVMLLGAKHIGSLIHFYFNVCLLQLVGVKLMW